jgi:hypothetical protein
MHARRPFIALTFAATAAFALVHCGDWKNTEGSSAGVLSARSACYYATAGQCSRDFLDGPDLRARCEALAGVYRNTAPLCPATDNVGTCACPPAPDGTFVAPIDFYAPLYACAAMRSACMTACYRDRAGNAILPGSFSGPC